MVLFAIFGVSAACLLHLSHTGSAATRAGAASSAATGVDASAVAFDALARQAALTDRELDVLRLYIQGRTASFIAGQLYVSEPTVKTHIRRAYAKLGAHGRQELISLVESTAAAAGDAAEPGETVGRDARGHMGSKAGKGGTKSV